MSASQHDSPASQHDSPESPSGSPTPPGRPFVVRFLREWGPIALLFGVLYVTGLHTEAFGRLQQLMLHTGVFNARADLPEGASLENAPMAGELIVESADGGMVHMSDLRGRTVFVNFWATWCPPCIAEMPSIAKLAAALPEEADVVFLMVSLDDNPADARRFMASKGFDLPFHFLRMRDRSTYSVSQIPTTYVISPDGRVVYERTGLARYDTPRFRRFLEGLADTAGDTSAETARDTTDDAAGEPTAGRAESTPDPGAPAASFTKSGPPAG